MDYGSSLGTSQHAGINIDYFKSPQGIVRIFELVLCFICLITSSVLTTHRPEHGGTWLLFVASVSLSFLSILTIFELFGAHGSIRQTLPIWPTFVLCKLVALTGFWFIAAIVCAVYGYSHSSAAASAFFAFVATAAFAVDTYFAFMTYRSATQSGSGHSAFPPPDSRTDVPPASDMSEAGYQGYNTTYDNAGQTKAENPPAQLSTGQNY